MPGYRNSNRPATLQLLPLRLVRIRSVRIGFFILAAVCWAQSGTDQALPKVAEYASGFWQSSAGFVGRETLKQKALVMPKKRIRVGGEALGAAKPELKDREILSFYALSSFKATPEALHEFREIVSIDGRASAGSREKLVATIESNDDHAKKALQGQFEKANLTVAATDFGQLLLLFTRANLAKYSFERRPAEMLGADRAFVFAFQHISGGEALRVTEAGKRVNEPLSGEIWVRESDFLPLRVTLKASRIDQAQEIRDEARVDYAPQGKGLVLPASVVYRRFIGTRLVVENICEYSDWQPVHSK